MKKVALCLFLFLCACGTSQPTNFYALTVALPKEDKDIVYGHKDKIIAVDQVIIPAYLQRMQIVTKSPDGLEVQINEFNRWVEPLSDSTQRVLTDDLSYYLQGAFVKNSFSNRMPYDYRIFVEVNKIDAVRGEKIYFGVNWGIADKKNKSLYNERKIYEAELANSYEDLARKQSKLLDELAKDIAKRMRKIQ
ncbi:MAG: PqiC family protein [Alphaproteobacteria bacterium]|nr:PqiC family protein [Alphaproteobacteria bacterium]